MSYFKSEIPNFDHIKKLSEFSSFEKEILWRSSTIESKGIVWGFMYIIIFGSVLLIPLGLMELFDNLFLKLLIFFPGMIFTLPKANKFAEYLVLPYRLKHFKIYVNKKSIKELKEQIVENEENIKEEIEKETII